MTGSFDYNPSTSVVTNVAITVTFPGGTRFTFLHQQCGSLFYKHYSKSPEPK